MNRGISVRIAAMLCVVAVGVVSSRVRSDQQAAGKDKPGGSAPAEGKVEGVLSLTVKDIDGKDVALSQYRGKVLLIVNTASRCGFTPQYAKLQELYDRYKGRGFLVLGFPSNDFGSQEPLSDPEIKQFCSSKFNVQFPMFSKVHVKGKDSCELYKLLTGKATNPRFGGAIRWNFTKFLVDREGQIVGRYEPREDPVRSTALHADLERSLKETDSAGGKGKP